MTRRFLTIIGSAAVVGLLALLVATPAVAGWDRMHGWRGDPSGEPATIAAARERAEQYLAANGLEVLTAGGVIQFERHFYVVVVDQAGAPALELVVSRDAAIAHPAPGPGMLWNTAFELPALQDAGMMSGSMGMHGAAMPADMTMHGTGMMDQGGMHGAGMGMHDQDRMHDGAMPLADCPMAGSSVPGSAEPLAQPLTVDATRELAQTWLDANRDGLTVTTSIVYPGYVTFVVEDAGAVTELLSVQLATGALWEQTWHGAVVAEEGVR